MTSLRDRALLVLDEWVQSESLRKHCYAVADSMRHFATLRGTDPDLWEAVGLLHDMDYERHPNQERSPAEGHPFAGVAWLREHGWSDEVGRAILSHADYANVAREAPLERTLYAVDELSGFVMAVARVRPSKSIQEVDVAAAKKKMKDKAFARAVDINPGADCASRRPRPRASDSARRNLTGSGRSTSLLCRHRRSDRYFKHIRLDRIAHCHSSARPIHRRSEYSLRPARLHPHPRE